VFSWPEGAFQAGNGILSKRFASSSIRFAPKAFCFALKSIRFTP
jgi:hypothetical protein